MILFVVLVDLLYIIIIDPTLDKIILLFYLRSTSLPCCLALPETPVGAGGSPLEHGIEVIGSLLVILDLWVVASLRRGSVRSVRVSANIYV